MRHLHLTWAPTLPSSTLSERTPQEELQHQTDAKPDLPGTSSLVVTFGNKGVRPPPMSGNR